MISLSLILTGCIPFEDPNVASYTEEELAELIEELMPEASVSTTYDLESFQLAVTDMLSVARLGIIGVKSESDSGISSGSGVIYKKEGSTYYAITNHHVVEDSTSMVVVYEKNGVLFYVTNEYTEILGSDPTTDLAVFTFQSNEDFLFFFLFD